MDTLTLAIILIALAGLGFLTWQLTQKVSELKEPRDDQAQKMMLEVIEALRKEVHTSTGEQRKDTLKTLELLEAKFANLNKSVDQRIGESTKNVNERLDKAAHEISKLTKTQGVNQQISEQLAKLTDFLRHGKRRGGMGEEILNDMLADALGVDQFQMQYRFRSGETVDAVVKTTNGLIPIDAKFPLENFRAFVNAETESAGEAAKKEFLRDVKKHIDAIAKKYILPDEDTTDFAIMYIPAESVHYEAAIASDEVAEYARSKRVHLVSPNGLFYFLRVILIAFQSQKFEENAKQVLSLIAGVKKESEKFGEGLQLTSKHLNNAKKNMDETVTGWDRLEGRIERVSELGEGEAVAEPELKKERELERLPLE